MNRINTMRIVLAALCFVETVLLTFAPIFTYDIFGLISGDISTVRMFRVIADIGDTFHMGDTAVMLPIVNIVVAISLLIVAVLVAVPSMNKIPSGVIALVASSLFVLLSTICGIILSVVGGFDVVGWGAYVTVALNIAVFVFSIIVLAKKEANNTPPSDDAGGGNRGITYTSGFISGLSGAYASAKFDISDGRPVKFGRDVSCCQIVFDQFETTVSRVHCMVAFNRVTGQYNVRDLSKNGTFINTMQNRLPYNEERNVPRGTIIYIGSSKNSFRLD